MKIRNITKGFTLIELLVVITIIGILATGAVSVYTSQIQKARDTTRISDMTALKGGLEQTFQDMSMYPGEATTKLKTKKCDQTANSDGSDSSVYCTVKLGFLNSLPKDPKSGQSGNSGALDYTYNVGSLDGVALQVYEISTSVESTSLVKNKAANQVDGGNDSYRIEFGIPGANLVTCTKGTSNCTTDSSNTAITKASCTKLNNTNGVVVIKGNCL